MYLLAFYVPSDFAEAVKNALFQAGAGAYRNYDSCSFETKGRGQFRPLKGANPFIGNCHQIEIVEELKIEMIVKKELIYDVIGTLKEIHPYEEVAYYVLEMLEF